MKRTLPVVDRADLIKLPAVNDALRPLVADYLKAASKRLFCQNLVICRVLISALNGAHDLVTVADKNAEVAGARLRLQAGHCIGGGGRWNRIKQYAGDGYAVN